jgi:hypothetical protein
VDGAIGATNDGAVEECWLVPAVGSHIASGARDDTRGASGAHVVGSSTCVLDVEGAASRVVAGLLVLCTVEDPPSLESKQGEADGVEGPGITIGCGILLEPPPVHLNHIENHRH